MDPIGQQPPESLIELAASARRVLENMLRVETHHPDLDWARQTLDEVAERLARIGTGGNTPRVGPSGAPDSRPYYFPGQTERPVRAATPWMTGEQDGTGRRGRVRFDLIHEGPPGWVHGGHVAWFFDMVLGQCMLANAIYAPTRKLEVDYRRPTRVLRELRYEATLEGEQGRAVVAKVKLFDNDELVSEAIGHFVPPRDRGA